MAIIIGQVSPPHPSALLSEATAIQELIRLALVVADDNATELERIGAAAKRTFLAKHVLNAFGAIEAERMPNSGKEPA